MQSTITVSSGRSARKSTPSNKPKKPKRVRKSRKRAKGVTMTNAIHPCTLRYLHAITDPFGFRNQGSEVCIPDTLSTPSYKFRTFTRFITNLQSNGRQFVSVFPLVFANAITPVATVWNGVAGTTFPDYNSASIVQIMDSQYPWSAVGSGPAVRLVACGVRCRYIGTNLNMAGLVVPVATRSSNDTLVSLTFDNVAARPDTICHNNDRKWKGTFYRPVNGEVFNYQQVSSLQAVLGLAMSGTANETVEVEIIRYFEAIPRDAVNVPGATKSDSDLPGLGVVMDTISNFGSSLLGSPVFQDALIRLRNYATENMIPLTAAGLAAYSVNRPRLEY